VRPPCMEGPPATRLACERSACALCSATCVALARSLQRPVSVAEAEHVEGRVSLLLEPEGGA